MPDQGKIGNFKYNCANSDLVKMLSNGLNAFEEFD